MTERQPYIQPDSLFIFHKPYFSRLHENPMVLFFYLNLIFPPIRASEVRGATAQEIPVRTWPLRTDPSREKLLGALAIPRLSPIHPQEDVALRPNLSIRRAGIGRVALIFTLAPATHCKMRLRIPPPDFHNYSSLVGYSSHSASPLRGRTSIKSCMY